MTYYCINELLTPYFEIFFFSHVCSQKQFEEIQNGSLGLVQERSHIW
jgi:hypothetical protein